jgi:hypothetical protein
MWVTRRTDVAGPAWKSATSGFRKTPKLRTTTGPVLKKKALGRTPRPPTSHRKVFYRRSSSLPEIERAGNEQPLRSGPFFAANGQSHFFTSAGQLVTIVKGIVLECSKS